MEYMEIWPGYWKEASQATRGAESFTRHRVRTEREIALN